MSDYYCLFGYALNYSTWVNQLLFKCCQKHCLKWCCNTILDEKYFKCKIGFSRIHRKTEKETALKKEIKNECKMNMVIKI